MASSIFKVVARSVTAVIAHPNINDLNIDVFIMILQELIEEEADNHLVRESVYGEPRMAVTLSLVCRKWKDIVYSTPSFWSIIKLSMNYSVDSMQTKLNVLASRAKNAPVDLHISTVHLDSDRSAFSSEYHSEDCCCKVGSDRIRLDFTGLLNVRRLRVYFTEEDAIPLFDLSAFPLNHLKAVKFFVYHSGNAHTLDLNTFLRHAPRIEVLDLDSVEIHNLSWASANQPLMPNLRTLVVTSGSDRHDPLYLTRLLSHAPNIEELTMKFFEYSAMVPISIPVPNQFSESTKRLSKLRKIDTDGFTNLNWLFTECGIKVPNLQELMYSESNLQGDDNDVKRFFTAHSSIKKITVRTGRHLSRYAQHLFWAPNIEELTIVTAASSQLDLYPLCIPTTDENTSSQSYICPKLRIITITDPRHVITPPSFEEFVRARCQPVDENGTTATGCKVIEAFRIESSTRANTYLFATKAWERANVWKISDYRYELRWLYNHSPAANVNARKKKRHFTSYFGIGTIYKGRNK